MNTEPEILRHYEFESHSLPEFVDQMDICRSELLRAAENFACSQDDNNFKLMEVSAKGLNTEFCQAAQLVSDDQSMGFFNQIRTVRTLKQHELTTIAQGFNGILGENTIEMREPENIDALADSLIERGLRGKLTSGINYRKWYKAETKTFQSELSASIRKFSTRCVVRIQ